MKTYAEAMREAARMGREFEGDRVGVVGFGVAHLIDEDGNTKAAIPFANLITTVGDAYYAQKGIVGVAPAAPAAPTAVNGMKLGTATTATAKSGAGAASNATFVAGSNLAFDASYPQAAAVGGDTGWYATYKTTWAAGVATNSTINEVAIVTDQGTASASAVAATISRAVLGTTVVKTSTDTLAVTWNHKFLGA